MSTTPCATCPWRRGADPDDIPNFNSDKARNLRCTVGDGDRFRQVMACHHSEEGDERPCIGYVAVEGYSNLNVRMMALRGTLDLRAIADGAETLDLYDSFDEMLDNLEAPHPATTIQEDHEV